MRRFTIDDNPRQRKRHATGTTGFLSNMPVPKASSTFFLTPQPKSHTPRPFTFVFKSPPVQSSGLRAWAQGTSRGQSTMSNGVMTGLGPDKLAAAFREPFHGVSLDDAATRTPVMPADTDITSSAFESEGFQNDDDATPAADTVTEPSIAKRIRKLWTEFPILPWKFKWREIFLREAIRLDGRAEALHLTSCPGCEKDGFPEYRCEDCRGADLCKDCIIRWHRYSPLHRIERFTESEFYQRADGADLGIRIQLLHRPGDVCKLRSLHSVNNFTIIHTNGMHIIPVDFCNCELGRDVPYHIQLMRWRMWPATCENPQTATTFEALDLFTRLSVLGRLNVYDFYRALEAATDGAMLRGVANVRQQLSNCARQFRHIMMFKRAGRGHEPGGIAGTPSGACAVRCPACPDFDLNVPKDWALSPFRWLYRVILAMDANFRLSNKLNRSTKEKDPNLTDGKAYMAPWVDYAAHIAQTNKELAQQSNCSRFSALELANQRGGRGQRSTGIAACVCARHEILQPLGAAPLRKGERYETMDWVFCGALSHIRAAEVTLSYDVVCQYSKRLAERLARIPSARVIWAGAQAFAKLTAAGQITYVVPKFHLYAHKAWCQLRYAFGWLFGTAVTDGEAPERVWSGVNPAASSLREMGPGGNNDTMDDMFGAWNWAKTCGMGLSLRERMDRALDEGDMQTEIHTEFTDALQSEDPARVTASESFISSWESSDKSKAADADCPYYAKKQGLSIEQIKLQTEEAHGCSTHEMTHHDPGEDVELAHCLLQGIEIEDERIRIAMKYGDEGGTTKQATTKTQALNALVRAIIRFRAEQEYTMPVTYAALTADERDPERKVAMTIQLCMPSSPPDGDRSLVSEVERTMEAKLRWAEMTKELDKLLHQLRLKGCLHKHRVANITGQRSSTRALTTQASVNANVKRAADAYRRHREAYHALVGAGEWETTMRKLDDSDCRYLGDRLIEQIEGMSKKNIEKFLQGRGKKLVTSGETRYQLPWIWYTWDEQAGAEIGNELMVEWAKSRARAQHWVQEVRLVDAEMQRVIDFSDSMAQIWDARRECEVTIDLGEKQDWASDEGWADGIRAYASKQAFIRRAQAAKWRKEFSDLRVEAKRFLTVHTEEGLSIEPSTLLLPEEVEDMRRRTDKRRDRRHKPKVVQHADASDADDSTDEQPIEPDSRAEEALHTTEPEFTGAQGVVAKKKSKATKAKASGTRSRRSTRAKKTLTDHVP